jgi:hypothetical protein
MGGEGGQMRAERTTWQKALDFALTMVSILVVGAFSVALYFVMSGISQKR